MDTTHQTDDEQTALWNGPPATPGSRRRSRSTGCSSRSKTCSSKRSPPNAEGRVLDVGCGTGGTTLAVARRLGAGAAAIGIDISEPMIAAARARAEREGSPASFIRADAQTHAFEPASFDTIISRFGVMFFDDPSGPSRTCGVPPADDAELRFIAWRSAEENPFMTTAERAAAPLLPNLPPGEPDAPGQFAFADPERVSPHSGGRAAGPGSTSGRSTCLHPAREELVGYLTRLGPSDLILHDTDEQTRAQVIETVRPPLIRTCTERRSASPLPAGWLVRERVLVSMGVASGADHSLVRSYK